MQSSQISEIKKLNNSKLMRKNEYQQKSIKNPKN
jgi:hypothetical protein